MSDKQKKSRLINLITAFNGLEALTVDELQEIADKTVFGNKVEIETDNKSKAFESLGDLGNFLEQQIAKMQQIKYKKQ
jgi:hypothetical protein